MEDAELARPLLTVEGNTFYEEDIVTQFREYSCNCTFYAEQPEDDKAPAFSYIDFERDAAGGHKIVTRIEEKERILKHANTGAYGFGSGSELLRYCRRVIDTDSVLSTVGHQFWMSCVYELMLQDGVQVLAAEVLKYQKIRDPMRLGTFYAKFVLGSKEILRICFDLDGTLVTDPLQPGDFTTVKPLPDNIGICRQLKEQGHVIIIHTGRAMGIHRDNVGMVLKDIAKLTFDQLDEFGIPYDEIYFGKPHADVYIDGKSVNPTTEFAKTLGNLVESEEAQQPRSAPGSPSSRKADDTDNDPSQYEMVEARHFNSLQFRAGSVCKYKSAIWRRLGDPATRCRRCSAPDWPRDASHRPHASRARLMHWQQPALHSADGHLGERACSSERAVNSGSTLSGRRSPVEAVRMGIRAECARGPGPGVAIGRGGDRHRTVAPQRAPPLPGTRTREEDRCQARDPSQGGDMRSAGRRAQRRGRHSHRGGPRDPEA
jgi:capsule biosynthesis phosphatase